MARPLIRIFVLIVLTILLAAPWSAAAPRQDLAPAPQLLARLWHQVVALWGDIGCIMDPHGGCRETSTPSGDIGCGIDPGGTCGH